MKGNQKEAAKEKGVKFRIADAENDDSISEASQLDNKSMNYHNIGSASNMALETFNECDSLYRLYTENDPYVKKNDTVKGVLVILDKLKSRKGLTKKSW
jgi:hypothetical protein